MTWWQTLLLAIYTVSLGLLMIVSLHRHIMVRLYFKYHDRIPKLNTWFQALPRVTVQLPVYNEMYVVERLIRAVAALEYPKDRLEIQVLDDSTDETTAIASRCVQELQQTGLDIVLVCRKDRVGYKAGALAEGLRLAKGELVAVFDADFVPSTDFLQKTVHHFTRPEVGLVQARWSHLNRDFSLLTKVQAIYLDGHFVMEHGARSRAGLFFNFNGTAGVWRKSCIEAVGGWQHDTLTEDLDLSYRAQLAGWEFLYLQDVVTPAEVPVEVNAWKSQQFRWAKGSVQTAKKLLGPVLASSLPWRVKGEAAFHLLTNFSYLLMAIVSILIFPAIVLRENLGWYRVLLVDLPLFAGATGVISRFYIYAQSEIYQDWKTRLKYLPAVLAFGMGVSLNNSLGVLQALVGYETAFYRTPKYQVVGKGDGWLGKQYGLRKNLMSYIEVGLGCYLIAAMVYASLKGLYFPIPFLGLFSFGFFYVGGLSLWQGVRRRRQMASTLDVAAAD
ncbi:MAG: cellulose synthase/poly-beta-1,6-N-acetylglucosamine synthase-like glycosyltransferase [Candidatus Latescibacterota bacterium]|jgi:cellulose synthase/poly-beta-1,6-N-acetylglucosamine synthase-like glycosyltransferase